MCLFAVLLQSKHHEKNVVQTFVKKIPCVKEKYTKQTENIKLAGSVLGRKKTGK
jgi:hypothetical protein